MPPAAVKRHGEIGIAPARDRDDPRDRVVEAVQIEREMPGLAAFGRGEDDAAALAHRGGGQQIIGGAGGLRVTVRRRPHSSQGAASACRLQLVAARRARRARNTRPPFSPRSRPARRAAPARPGSRPARRSRSPGPRSASGFMFDIDTQRSMRRIAEPVEHVRHQFLKAHVLHAGDAFGAAGNRSRRVSPPRCRLRAL